MNSNGNLTEQGMTVPALQRRLLIVEDEKVFARAVQKRLARAGYSSEIALDLAAAHAALRADSYDMILLDMRLPDGSGLDLLSFVGEQPGEPVPVVVMSAYGEIGDAVSAMKLGASDYLKKPVDLDELMLCVDKVLEQNELSRKLEYSSVREHYAAEEVSFLGQSPAIEAVRRQVEQIGRLTQKAETTPPVVLLLGETGTGKDVVARLLHAHQPAQLAFEGFDLLALLADHDARPGREDRNARVFRGSLDDYAPHGSMRELLLEKRTHLDVVGQHAREGARAGVPARAPVSIDRQPETDRIDLLSHNISLSRRP